MGARFFHQRRIGPGGYLGLEMSACIEMAADHGVPRRIAALLLPYWEAGILQAVAKAQSEKDET